jgi:hypothetical protein
MIRTVLGLIMAVALTPIVSCLVTTSAQQPASPITKASALKNVRISSLPGWSETVSDECSFRILFPGKPQIDNDAASRKGFKLANSSGKWSASCADLGRTVPNDESALRQVYQQSMDAMTHNKTYLIASGDVFLNGRLGIEFRIRGLSQTSYTQAFVFGRRLYTISVTRKKTAEVSADNPADVQQFFDSFAYWD